MDSCLLDQISKLVQDYSAKRSEDVGSLVGSAVEGMSAIIEGPIRFLAHSHTVCVLYV
jgi:hypothetical protein